MVEPAHCGKAAIERRLSTTIAIFLRACVISSSIPCVRKSSATRVTIAGRAFAATHLAQVMRWLHSTRCTRRWALPQRQGRPLTGPYSPRRSQIRLSRTFGMRRSTHGRSAAPRSVTTLHGAHAGRAGRQWVDRRKAIALKRIKRSGTAKVVVESSAKSSLTRPIRVVAAKSRV